LQVLCGAGRPFEESAPILSRALGSRGALRCGGGEKLKFLRKKLAIITIQVYSIYHEK